jgi:hypothetical protein
MRGVDPILILRELLGKPDGLCGGMGGHMHLLASSGSFLRHRRSGRSHSGWFCAGSPVFKSGRDCGCLFWRRRHESGNADGVPKPGCCLALTGSIRMQGR